MVVGRFRNLNGAREGQVVWEGKRWGKDSIRIKDKELSVQNGLMLGDLGGGGGRSYN